MLDNFFICILELGDPVFECYLTLIIRYVSVHCTHTIYECSSLTKFNSTLSSKCGKFWHPKNDSIGGQKLTLSQSPNPVYDARRLRPSFTKFVVSPRSVMLDIFYNIRVMRKEALTSSLQENIH